ncbi:coat protein [Metarhizium brunneum partitivirus 2]|nr:coat protein [Metarhizium brunneum partitivirus 2]
MNSSVAPSDSASAVASKRSKPGKAERAARRAVTDSTVGQPASVAKAMTFSSGVQAPKPQPGKFPVVFQTGAGEPSRDVSFAIDTQVLENTLTGFPPSFKENAKYAEFLSYSEYDDDDFYRQLKSAALLRLAQQLVHSHVNMGLPQGDFAPVASTEVRVPGSIAAFVTQYGEYSVPALGTRFLLKDYASTVKSLVWAADQMASDSGVGEGVVKRSWLPVSQHDGHTRQIVAAKLNQFLSGAEISYQSTELEKAVLSGTAPTSWEELKPLLGDKDKRDRFDFLFKSYKTAPELVVEFSKDACSAVLTELGLPWDSPSAGHVSWSFNVKETFTRLSDEWAKKSATYAQFFELSSSQSNRSAASGSQSQLAIVKTSDSITVVKTHLALSAPEFSLVACFPASGIFSGSLNRNVVLTTPLSVVQRATEFVQMDWR